MLEENKGIKNIEIESEMKKSYIDYAMSVIVGRALPDVRDGLKPVHRRILYAMHEIGLVPEKGYRKSATVVGDVLGKYHPHGDSSVYDAMVRLAQDFSMRYTLVNGHGNFGSIDGDNAAAMRYTEAKMQKLSMELLKDIDKQTVDFVDNYDGRLKEPTVLPAKYPNLLVNGSNGIAVGMATSIPPHNLNEIIDGTIHLLDNEDCEIEDLMEFIKGPDFPTGATVMGLDNLKKAYKTGRGKVKVRANHKIEDIGKGKCQIIFTDIPYQVNKARLIEKIADLVKDKKIEGITDLRDESDRKGIRIVVELKRDANPDIVVNNIYKHSQLQDTYSIIMIALVNGEPKVLNLKQILSHYLKHQKQVITRRTQFELKKAQDKEHILLGQKIALDRIDEVISTIRNSKGTKEAKEALLNEFSLTEIQAQAILDMRLQKLTGLEQEKIETELEELKVEIQKLKAILEDEELLKNIIRDELTEVREKYKDDRKTDIQPDTSEINIEDLIEDEDVSITLTHFGYIKRVPSSTYRIQNRGGKGIAALSTRENDFVKHLINTTAHAKLVFFTNRGRVYKLKAYEIPEGKRQAKGTAIVNLIPLEKDEYIRAIIPVKGSEDDDKFLILATKEGIVKKTKLEEYRKSNRNGLIGISLREEDELIGVNLTTGEDEIILVTKNGMSIRFCEEDVRPMGRTAMGVKGIKLKNNDKVVAMNKTDEGDKMLIVSENGFGKRTLLEEYTSQKRGGTGLITYRVTDKTGAVSGAKIVNDDDELMIINSEGTLIRIEVDQISTFKRATSGVKLMRNNDEQKIVSIAKIMGEE
ncbi:DNA gyrase subunit A [Peptostreptococcaceae bacterium AGR-M142]